MSNDSELKLIATKVEKAKKQPGKAFFVVIDPSGTLINGRILPEETPEEEIREIMISSKDNFHASVHKIGDPEEYELIISKITSSQVT